MACHGPCSRDQSTKVDYCPRCWEAYLQARAQTELQHIQCWGGWWPAAAPAAAWAYQRMHEPLHWPFWAAGMSAWGCGSLGGPANVGEAEGEVEQEATEEEDEEAREGASSSLAPEVARRHESRREDASLGAAGAAGTRTPPEGPAGDDEDAPRGPSPGGPPSEAEAGRPQPDPRPGSPALEPEAEWLVVEMPEPAAASAAHASGGRGLFRLW